MNTEDIEAIFLYVTARPFSAPKPINNDAVDIPSPKHDGLKVTIQLLRKTGYRPFAAISEFVIPAKQFRPVPILMLCKVSDKMTPYLAISSNSSWKMFCGGWSTSQ